MSVMSCVIVCDDVGTYVLALECVQWVTWDRGGDTVHTLSVVESRIDCGIEVTSLKESLEQCL